jgi:sugar/nucleoside kinase (ribokinase family)
MNLLVAGQSVVDIITSKGNKEKKPGGIHYSILALKSFAEYNDEIFLCSSLSKKDEPLFKETYNYINKKYVRYVDEIPTVSLAIHDNKERDETYSNIARNLILPHDDLYGFDGIFINMVTGYDLTLKQMKNVRQNYKGLIYFDIHTMSRGVDDNMKRNFRPIPDFKSWAENIDILQANEQEILTLSNQTDELEIVKEIFTFGIKIFIITKAENGVRVYFKDKNEIESVFIPAINVKTLNKVGCGDVFGAVFFYNYISRQDVIHSLKLANITAGISTTYSGIEDFNNLKSDVLKRFSEK